MPSTSDVVVKTARVVLEDVPAPAPFDTFRRGDILPLELTDKIPNDALSQEFPLAKDDVLFLIDKFDREHFNSITVIPAGPPGSPREPFEPQLRSELDVYGPLLNHDQIRKLVLRRENGLYVNASAS